MAAKDARRNRPLDNPSEGISCASALVSCTGCHGHSLTLRGEVVQCDDCGAIQAAIIYRPRIVERITTAELE